MSKPHSLSLNSLQLKIIGFVLTLAGAIGAAFFSGEDQQIVRFILELISYPAITIFTFLLVEGFQKTQNLKKYAISLAVAAVITEPFYDYACIGSWIDLGSANGQNFLISLLFCMLVLVLLRSIDPESKWRVLMICSIVPAVVFWGFIINARYSICAGLLTVVFYLLREKPRARDITAAAVGTVISTTAGLSVLLTRKYDGQRGNYPKHLFYALYPAMWVVLAVFKLVIA